jgi:hypothetical protein
LIVSQVDVDGIPEFGHHAAIPAVEPLEVAIYDKKTKGQYRRTVYGFTAAGQPLVLDKQGGAVVPVGAILKPGETAHIQKRDTRPYTAVGPFTSAPAGMTAVFSDGRRLPVVYYDVHGRPTCIYDGEKSRVLIALDEDDEELVRIEGDPRVDTLHIAHAQNSLPND